MMKMMIKITKAVLIFSIIGALNGCAEPERYVETRVEQWELADFGEIYRTDQGYVPDAETAVRIAEAVLESAYGENTVSQQRPLRVMLMDSIWVVVGTIPENALGGVARVEIAKRDGTIFRVAHSE